MKYHLDRMISIPSVPSVEVGCGIGIAMLAVAVVVIWRLQLRHPAFRHQPFFSNGFAKRFILDSDDESSIAESDAVAQ